MILGKKRPSVEEHGAAQREKLVTFKRVFGSQDGKEVLFDLMDRYHVLNQHGGDPYKEGQRSVVLDILKRTNINLVEFDQILKGEFGA